MPKPYMHEGRLIKGRYEFDCKFGGTPFKIGLMLLFKIGWYELALPWIHISWIYVYRDESTEDDVYSNFGSK
jgi:hypothetical protein